MSDELLWPLAEWQGEVRVRLLPVVVGSHSVDPKHNLFALFILKRRERFISANSSHQLVLKLTLWSCSSAVASLKASKTKVNNRGNLCGFIVLSSLIDRKQPGPDQPAILASKLVLDHSQQLKTIFISLDFKKEENHQTKDKIFITTFPAAVKAVKRHFQSLLDCHDFYFEAGAE